MKIEILLAVVIQKLHMQYLLSPSRPSQRRQSNQAFDAHTARAPAPPDPIRAGGPDLLYQIGLGDTVHFNCPQMFFRFSPFCKESANVKVSVALFSITSNHAKIMHKNANALLVSFTKFEKTSFCARTSGKQVKCTPMSPIMFIRTVDSA
jgi:hypothetical protein